MNGRKKILAALVLVLGGATGLAACGSQGIQLSSNDPNYRGAVLFRDHCAGCHTLGIVGAEGSATKVSDRLRTNGPNFNQRKETAAYVLYAIRNGGFSGAIMPQNLVVGQDAVAIANFLAKYSGREATQAPSAQVPSNAAATGH